VRRRLDTNAQFRRYFEQETTELPRFYMDLARKDLGALWGWLPEGAMYHDPNAYLKSEMAMQGRLLRSETSDLRH
jgi:sulfite exporter TauE/SafE